MSSSKEDVIEELTRPIIKLVLALVGLFVLRFIITNLPGLDTSIPETPITFATVAGGIITLVMVGIVVNFGREIEPRMVRAIRGPEDVVTALAQATKFVIVLIAIILAYDGVDAMVVPFLVPDPGRWVYDALFLLVALLPTVIIARAIFDNLDEMTDLLTEQVKSATVDQVDCPDCGESVRSSLDFCPSCGEDLADVEVQEDDDDDGPESLCPDCGADVDESAAFCGSCGAGIGAD